MTTRKPWFLLEDHIMQESCKMGKEGLRFKIKGELDLNCADALRDRLDKEIKKRSARHLILDFSGVSFIDSSGLGVIIGRYRKLAPLGGKISICNCNAQVYRILEISGLTRIIQVDKAGISKRVKEGRS